MTQINPLFFCSEADTAIAELSNGYFAFWTGVSGWNNREDDDNETDAEHFFLESASESLLSDITNLLLLLIDSSLF